MARQLINIGTIENDGTGDKLRDAMDKINDNFREVYTELGGDSLSNLDISGNTISSANTNGDIILDPNGTGLVKVDNLAISGNTISSTDTNGNITIDPDGTGSITLSSDVSITGTLTIGTTITGNLTGNVTGNVTGTVSSLSNLTTDALAEGSSNLYFTTARARESLSVTGSGLSYDNTSGVFTFTDAVTSVNGQTGAVTIDVNSLDGDLSGSLFADDSTLMVNGVTGQIVGPINSSTGTITALTSSGITMTTGAGINASSGVIQGEYFYGENVQVENYLAFDSSLLIDGSTGIIYGAINNSTTATFSGTVDFNGATVNNLSLSSINADVTGNLTGNSTGLHTGPVDGDLIGSVFADDSTLIINGQDQSGSFTTVRAGDLSITGTTITSTAAGNQSLVLNVSGFGALQTNSDSFITASRTITDPLGAAGDVDNIFSQDDNYLYKSTAAYDGSTRIWKRVKLRDFDDPLFYVGADDSTMRGVNDLEGVKIIGGTNVTTTSDAEGNITINASASGSYSWSIGADDSTLRTIGSGESVKIIGGTNVTTSSDSEGNITIDASDTGISNVVEDTTPQLGGDLDINGFNIVSARSNENINIIPSGTGSVILDGDVTITGTLSGGSPLTIGNDVDFNSNNVTNLGTLNTHTVPGGTGTLALTSDITFTASSTDTLTNKTINSASNTITITESNISDLGSYITASSTDTLTNKSIALGSNTVTGTVLNIGADDSTLRAVGVGEGIKIIGGTGITTSSDAEGNITIDGAGAFGFSVGADDSTLRSIGSGESFKIIGGTNVTTTSDSEGNITVNTSAITSFNTAGNTGTGTVDVGGGESLLVTGTTGQINVNAGGFALSLSLDSNINSIQSIAFEGSTDDTNEITLTSADATADRTITLPDTTGYLATFDTDPGTTTITSTVAELNYMDGVTSNVQTQLDSKASSTGTVISIGADDSTLRAVTYGESIKIIGGTNVTTTSDAEGNITVNSSATGNVVDDTTPQLGGDLDLNGHSITTARSNEDLNLTPNGTGTVTINGGLKLEEGTQEKFSSLTSATGTVTHDCSNGTIFYHTSISADFTANFTNLQLDSTYATTISLVLVQGASEFIPNAVQIAGAAQTINWQGGVEPTGTDNGIDVVSFTILNNGGTYTVLAQLVDFT